MWQYERPSHLVGKSVNLGLCLGVIITIKTWCNQGWSLTPSTVRLSWNKLSSIGPVLSPWARCWPTGFWVWLANQRGGVKRQRLGGWQLFVLCWFTVLKPEDAHRSRIVTVQMFYCPKALMQESYNQSNDQENILLKGKRWTKGDNNLKTEFYDAKYVQPRIVRLLTRVPETNHYHSSSTPIKGS